jgi:hypothetical protein
MTKEKSITIRLELETHKAFEEAVREEFLRAVRNDEPYEHITTSEVLRCLIKAYCGGVC